MKDLYLSETEKSSWKVWDQDPMMELPADDIIKMYENGFAGAVCSDEADEEFFDSVTYPYATEVCDTFGFGDSAAGRLTLPFQYMDKLYGKNQWLDPAQGVGNCVARGQTYANLTTLCSEVVIGLPDALSGFVEILPKDERLNKSQCPLACEPVYWFRGHGGHGWICSQSTNVSLKHTGAIPRIEIEGVADFRKYNERVASEYGRRKPPQDIIDKIDNNLYREATKIDNFESLRELLSRGFGINSCGGEGFRSKRDENGVASRSGRWAHAMAYIGVDDRPEIHRIYGGPLVLILNSWGNRWISGPDKILGTELTIPFGSFWARWSDIKNRSAYAIAGLNGWKREHLPDLSPGAV